MSTNRRIQNALVSVYYKDHLQPIIQELHKLGVTLYSTGGTQDFIEKMNIPVERVEDLTGYPSILGGRVKTLHPKIFGGILGRRELASDKEEMLQYEIPPIDLVIVDLYPFEETLASGADESAIIEKIDIGGVSLIRAAAKNHKDTIIVASKNDYSLLLETLKEGKGETTIEQRKVFARNAFNITSHYDSAIFNYFNQDQALPVFKQSIQESQTLRYGENPHQKGVFYGNLDEIFEKLNGKELSYNNLVDVDAAIALIEEFQEPTFAILKHTNACGLASNTSVLTAWKNALACDPVSAFGGVIACNRSIDAATAAEMNSLFFEVLIAPDYQPEALTILKEKKNRVILKWSPKSFSKIQFKTLLNGVIAQDKDLATEGLTQMNPVTRKKATAEELEALAFAVKLVKHTKSNTIVLAKDGQLLSSGTGQTSRVDALRQAIAKAESFGFDLKGAVMASDAFFPFPDCVEIAHKAGITAIVQPGGSVKDQASIDYCDQNDLAMVFTGVRHFKH